MDKFIVKTPAVSSTKKASSHLPPNMTAHERARKYPEGKFHVDNGLMFCLSCNIVIVQKYCTYKNTAHKTKHKKVVIAFKSINFDQ